MCQFLPFCYSKVKENKMKPWKCHVLTTHTVCKHCWLLCYETDMGPGLSTAAANQNFAWICKQYRDLIGSLLIFRTKIIWSRPEFGLVWCGYLNAAIRIALAHMFLWRNKQILKYRPYLFHCSLLGCPLSKAHLRLPPKDKTENFDYFHDFWTNWSENWFPICQNFYDLASLSC